MAVNMRKLRAELRVDPLHMGYEKMSDTQAVTVLNSASRTNHSKTRAKELGLGHVSMRAYHEAVTPPKKKWLTSLLGKGAADG